MYFTRTPAYPFGYGRSYTTFGYSQAGVSRSRVRASGTQRISFTVTNTGSRAGRDRRAGLRHAAPGRAAPQAGRLPPHEVLAPGRRQTRDHRRAADPDAAGLERERRRQAVPRGVWRFTLARSATDPVRTFGVRVSGRIPRSVKTVTLAPAQLRLSRGQTIDLRGRNPWLDGLAPAHPQGDQILSAVRADDSFADLAGASIRFSSNRPSVAGVDAQGRGHRAAARASPPSGRPSRG